MCVCCVFPPFFMDKPLSLSNRITECVVWLNLSLRVSNSHMEIEFKSVSCWWRRVEFRLTSFYINQPYVVWIILYISLRLACNIYSIYVRLAIFVKVFWYRCSPGWESFVFEFNSRKNLFGAEFFFFDEPTLHVYLKRSILSH